MRVSQDEMEKSHERILRGAARLLRQRGIESTSVNDVMGEAGMKNGGFYRHFDSKEALVDAALQSAFDQIVSFMETRFHQQEPPALLAGFRAQYLSERHVGHPGEGCPVAALSGDIARASNHLKESFSAGLNRTLAVLSSAMPGSKSQKRNRAIREFALAVGAVVIARACEPQTKRAVLDACRKGYDEV